MFKRWGLGLGLWDCFWGTSLREQQETRDGKPVSLLVGQQTLQHSHAIELRTTVARLEALKFKAKAGGLLEKIQTMLAQQKGDERRFQVLG
ncbi:unnamed protein product [Leuciscus chuanchicus]